MVVPETGAGSKAHCTSPCPSLLTLQSRANTAGNPQGLRPSPVAEGSEKGRGKGRETRSLSPLSLYPVSALQTFSYAIWYPTSY